MRIADVLRHKGHEVYTILANHTIEEAAQILCKKQVGALVVRGLRGELAGIISERDVIRGIAESGSAILAQPVSELMSPDVITCTPNDLINKMMAVMTVHRVRHLPVIEGDRIIGMISIGDLVKHRLQEKIQEVEVLRELNIVRV
jgi:CBS domain-containing protein